MSNKSKLNYTSMDPDSTLLGDCIWELYSRVEALEDSAMKRTEKVLDKPEGHPIPQYDTEQCTKLFKAVFNDEAVNLESDLIDAALDFVDHYEALPEPSASTASLREWGAKNYELHEKLRNAAKNLSDL